MGVLSAIDAEISRLEEAKRLLGAGGGKTTRRRRDLSAEARAKIAAAQKMRWAAAKKARK